MTETKVCRKCSNNFEITEQDAGFCQQMKVALPELCAICGIREIMILRNEHTLYKGTCAKCKKSTLSMYHPNSPYTVWCHECWWKDDWDAGSYAKEYDPSRPLLEQYYELRKKVPREAVVILNSTNCDFTNHVRYSKDCYMVNLATYSESVFYSEWIVKGKEVFDCKKVNEGELIVECVDIINCSRSAYLQDCVDSSECFFSYDLKGCTNCLFSSGLRNKSYHVFNKQVSKEEFEKIKKEVLNGSYKTLQEQIGKCIAVRGDALHKYSQILNSKDCIGAYIEDSNRLTNCFDAIECEDVRASASIGNAKNGMYGYSMGWPSAEFFFGSSVMRGGNNIKFSFLTTTSSNCAYVDSAVTCNECVACVGLKHKEFSILNKQYSKEEYLKIKSGLEAKGELSISPGAQFSTFAYNESAAQTQYPLTKEQAAALGYSWQDEVPPTKGQETIMPEAIPDNIKDIGNDFLKQIFKCVSCARNYRVVQRELEMYRQFNLPLARECPQCRMLRRRGQRTPYQTWHRQCVCLSGEALAKSDVHQNTSKHFHGDKPCPNAFETPYAPDRPETVYCESCYQAEVV